MKGKTGIIANRSRSGILAWTSLAASLLIGGQLSLIVFQGESACFNGGCSIVEGLARVSPFVFNLFGLLFFLAIGLTAVFLRGSPAAGRFLSLLLLAAMAAEGVLLAYQYHVARAWCSYCLVIFGLVALGNLIVGLRQLLSGVALAVAVNIIFALLRFEPAVIDAQDGGLAAGTAAVLPGKAAGGSVYVIYSNDCPHCMTLLGKLSGLTDCTVRLNPVGDPPPADFDGLERMPSFEPEMNRHLLRLLQIDAVPVLVIPDNGGYRIIRSASGIEAYLANGRVDSFAGAQELEKNIPESDSPDYSQLYLPPAADKECRVDNDCGEPM